MLNPETTLTHTAMLRAAFSYFGIDADQMVLGSTIESQGPAIVLKAHIALTQDDVIGIVKRMEQLRADEPQKPLTEKLTVKLDAQEAMGAIAKVLEPGCILLPALAVEELRNIVPRKTLIDAGGIEGRGDDDQAEDNSEGVGGRKVVHADVPVQDADGGLPEAVWVDGDDLLPYQKRMTSDHDVAGDRYLLRVDFLVGKQVEKYGVQS